MPLNADEQQEAIRRAIDAIKNNPSSSAPKVENPVLNAIPSDKPPEAWQAPTTGEAMKNALSGKQNDELLKQLFPGN